MNIQIHITLEDGTIGVRGPYSESNNSQYRSLGGKFSNGKWTLPDNDTTRKTLAELFGERSEEVEVLAPAESCTGKYGTIVQLGGYVLAQRRGRDSRVEMPSGVSLAAGRFRSSGGSVKNPRVSLDDDVIFRVCVRKSFADSMKLQLVTSIPEAEKLTV